MLHLPNADSSPPSASGWCSTARHYLSLSTSPWQTYFIQLRARGRGRQTLRRTCHSTRKRKLRASRQRMGALSSATSRLCRDGGLLERVHGGLVVALSSAASRLCRAGGLLERVRGGLVVLPAALRASKTASGTPSEAAAKQRAPAPCQAKVLLLEQLQQQCTVPRCTVHLLVICDQI